MDLVAVDWFKDKKRMDHVARRPGCAAKVSFIGGFIFSVDLNSFLIMQTFCKELVCLFDYFLVCSFFLLIYN